MKTGGKIYWLYSVAALKQLPFDRNTNDFHFDTEIIIELLGARMRVEELADTDPTKATRSATPTEFDRPGT